LKRHLRPLAIGMAGDGREAVTAAIALADGGYPVVLHVTSIDWLQTLADGEVPFDAPHLRAPLQQALRAECLDVVPQAADAAERGGLAIITSSPTAAARPPVIAVQAIA
jgi:hypothetical protein